MTAAIITPVTSGRRIRHVQQGEASECGLACLAMASSHWMMRVDLNTLRGRHPVSSRGMSLRSLIQTAGDMGLAARAIKAPIERLGTIRLPAILHWDMNHFVLLERVSRGRAFILDPGRDARWHDAASLSKHYTGVALELSPGVSFKPATETHRLRVSQLWSSIAGAKRAFVQTAVLSLLLQIYVLASPYMMQAAIDTVIPAQDASLLTVLAIGFLMLALVNGASTWLRSAVLLSSGANLAYGITSNIFRHMLRLPVEWFEKRTVGDVLSRFQSVQPIQKLLTEGGAATVIDGALALLTLGVMVAYSPWISTVPVIALLVYAAVRWLSLPAERAAQGDRIHDGGREQGSMIETLRGVVTLRLSGSESMRHSIWQNRLSEEVGAVYRHETVKARQLAAGTAISSIETVIVTWLAVRSVLHGGFSVGMAFAFLAYRLQFSTSTRSLADRLSEVRMLSLHLDRLSDVAFADEDASFSEPAHRPEDLVGRIEVRGLRFSYGPHEPDTLKGVDLLIEPGEHVAITGSSGGGKTTLAKLILGLMEPTGGQVLVDGLPFARFGRRAFREHVGAVLQDDTLFAGTIAENVAGFEPVDQARFEQSMTAASVLDDVRAMPMREQTLVGDMGSTLSGGQRQRILLARALYRRPKVLVMDEGTSSLDADHERAVNDAISAMGITRIVIAHRKETIDRADRVVVLRGGVIESDAGTR